MTRSQVHPHANELLLPPPQLSAPARARKAAAAGASGPHGFSLEQVSNMLWAGFALNCHGSGGRAVAGRRGACEVEVFVCLTDGCYRYDPGDHALVLVSPRDARAWTGSHRPQPGPAIALVYVTDGPDEADSWEETGHIAGAEVPTIAGNVAAYSTAAGLVVRGEEWFHPQLAHLLGLQPRRRIALTQTVAALPGLTHH
jgi:hypothetical protein